MAPAPRAPRVPPALLLLLLLLATLHAHTSAVVPDGSTLARAAIRDAQSGKHTLAYYEESMNADLDAVTYAKSTKTAALHRIPRCLEQRPLVSVAFMTPREDGRALFAVVTMNARRTGRYCAMLVSVRVLGPPSGAKVQMGVYEYGDTRQPDTGSAGDVYRGKRKNALRTFTVPKRPLIVAEWLEPRFDDYRKLAGLGFLIRTNDAKFLAVGVLGLANPGLPGTMG